MNRHGFVFANELPVEGSDTFLACLSSGISSKKALFRALYEELQMPGYFGFNWDALADCLSDLHWIAQKNLVLMHKDVPALPSDDLQVYLKILAESMERWSDSDTNVLTVTFPAVAVLTVTFPAVAREHVAFEQFEASLQKT